MSSFDELDLHFGVGTQLRDTIRRRFGSASAMMFSIRWWPNRDAPTSAFAGVYRSGGPPAQTHVGASPGGVAPVPLRSSMPVVEAWFVISRDVVEEPTALLSRAIEIMSPIPHAAVMSVVDAYDFFQLGRALREKPSTLATDLAEVWHAPKVVAGRLTFFAFSEMRFRRVSIDLETARVDDTPL